jgi:DNA-binding MarR family transcriptional regulator
MGRDGASQPDAVDLLIEQWARERPELDVSPMQVLGRLHRSFLRYQSQISERFAEHGINMAAFDVLAALRRSGPPFRRTTGELAATALVTSAGASLRVDRLEQTGLVERERDAEDRRIVYVRLTPAGRRLVDEVADVHFANEARMIAGLSPADRHALAGLLRKLEQSLAGAERPADAPVAESG